MNIDENIKVNIDNASNKITVKVNKPKIVEFKLNARKALNGDIMIFDHSDIDIVVLLEKKKIIAFAKDLMSEVVYGAESRLFEFLKKKGVIAFDSIKGGNVYGSLEGTILESKELDSIKLSLLNISKWISSEKPYMDLSKNHDDLMSDYLTNPSDDMSTDLGEIPHEEEKGSIKKNPLFASPYLYGKYTY